jgi:REP element-mobilizing transposase RayT
MPPPPPLHPGHFYHIYNRGNNRQNIFFEERNYFYFMQLYTHHVEPAVQTYAYCLLRNHFHLLVYIKPDQETGQPGSPVKPLHQRFSNFFNAYARTINQTYGRSGALFQRPFGRIPVQSNAHLLHLVWYIHHNPQKHAFVDDFRAWPYSSYQALCSQRPTRLERPSVHSWFDGKQGFLHAHTTAYPETPIHYLIQDDQTY